MTIEVKAQMLLDFVNSLPGFRFARELDYGGYDHMGAIIVAAVLQSGLTWKTTVVPRVIRLLGYPEAATVSGFLRLTDQHGIRQMLGGWNGPKPKWMVGVARFLVADGVETEDDLRSWLESPGNGERLLALKGIKDKTLDFFKMLVGIPTSAVDRHLGGMLSQAGVSFSGYYEAREITNLAADLNKMDRRLFDMSIWQFMSERAGKIRLKPCGTQEALTD
jgi:hypothetical protein